MKISNVLGMSIQKDVRKQENVCFIGGNHNVVTPACGFCNKSPTRRIPRHSYESYSRIRFGAILFYDAVSGAS
jgi:hypothetical protein